MSTDKSQQIKYIASVVRALVNSGKQPRLLSEILRDYPEVESKPLPYRSLGFSSAEELLSSTSEFIFTRSGGKVWIAAKVNKKTAHITSMVRAQKSSKTTRLSATNQVRQPKRTDMSWNKSSYSSNIFQKLPASGNRFIDSQNRANGSWGDRNNNSQQTNNRNNTHQYQQHQKPKDLREMLNSKVDQQGGGRNPRPILGHVNQKQQQQQQQLSTKQQQQQMPPKQQQQQLPPKQQQQQQFPQKPQQQQFPPKQQQQQGQHYPPQQQQQQKPQQPQQQQLLQNNAAVAYASSLILAQREQKMQENRQLLLDVQRQQQQKQEQHLQRQQKQQQQQQQQQQQMFQPRPDASVCGNMSGRFVASVQNRLKIVNANGTNTTNGNSHYNGGGNSAGITPETSPAISSAGSEQLRNPFALAQQQEFNNTRFMTPQPQESTQAMIPPTAFQFNPKLDPVTSLQQYCVVRRFKEPEYSIFRYQRHHVPLYNCRVKVNDSIFANYPNEYPTEHLAKIKCAQKAIDQLRMQEMPSPLPPCTDNEFVKKLSNKLLSHPHGIFMNKIPNFFEDTFKQSMPENWKALVQSSKEFTSETAPTGNTIIFRNMDAPEDDTLSVDSITIQMDGITLPWSQKYWDLYITHCCSTVEVWARLFGKEYNERFDNLMNEIDVYMMSEKTRPLSIACKSIYLVCISECWHRVRVEEMDKLNGSALCFFMDFGDADWVDVSKLYICDAQFLRLPAQAVPMSLYALEDFADNPNARRHLDKLLSSKSVVGEILTNESDFYATDSSARGKIQVVLFDTSSQEDVNLNHLLLNQICDDTPPPTLKPTGVTNVLVTHVSEQGDLYFQIPNTELKYVKKLIDQIIESKFKREQHKITRADLKISNLFLICDDDADDQQPNWYRGALTEAQPRADKEEFDIFYVDHGQTLRTHISKIFLLESLSYALSKFPRQAIKARLYNIPDVTKTIVGLMRGLMPANCEALVKLVNDQTTGPVPLVFVYRRFDTLVLCTVNDVIRLESELESSSYALNGDESAVVGPTSPTTGLSSPNSSFDMTRGLTITTVPNSPQKSGEIPKLKNYEAIPAEGNFEVRITMSANPSNFMIQPYKDYPRLNSLMKELQDYCENNDEFIPADMVEKGQAYAAKNPDGFYHRVNVVATYGGEMIHVCFCDFGDIAVVRSDQLKILPAKFRQLPQMAIQAKLHGIVARDGDWTLDDCQRFRQLTVGQTFQTNIKRITYDRPGTPILELELIDVKTEDDIFIHKLLLTEQRAKEVN